MVLGVIESWGFLGREESLGSVLELAVRSKEDACLMSRPRDDGGWGSLGKKIAPAERAAGQQCARAESILSEHRGRERTETTLRM